MVRFEKHIVHIEAGARINYTTRSRTGEQIVDESEFVTDRPLSYVFNTYRETETHHILTIGSIKNSTIVLKINKQ